MRIVAFAALAASAAAFSPATAQTVQDPDPYYGVPPPPPGRMMPPRRPGPQAGMTWQAPQGGMAGPPPMRMDGQQMHMDGQHMDGQQVRMMQMRNMQMRPMPMGPQGQMHHMQRGGRVPPGFMGPRFEVRDWRRFGFPAPFPGGRWIRFENDALLIDGEGRIFDSRPDWDWDGYADGRMAERDGRSWEEGAREVDEGRGAGDVRTRVFVQHGPPPGYGGGYGPPPPPPGYGGGYGYGYGGYGSVIVTETTVTEAPVVEQRRYVRTYVQRVRVVHHRRRHVRCGCRPAPVLGERG
jgi:Ni/Co efflux regulator RcnB